MQGLVLLRVVGQSERGRLLMTRGGGEYTSFDQEQHLERVF